MVAERGHTYRPEWFSDQFRNLSKDAGLPVIRHLREGSRCRTRLFTRQPRHLPRAVTEAGTTEVQASAPAGLSIPDRGRLPDATPTRPTRSARKRKVRGIVGALCS